MSFLRGVETENETKTWAKSLLLLGKLTRTAGVNGN
jgi:hypothetical protein